MALYKLDEFYPNYREELFDGDDVKGLDVYAGETSEKIGTIENVLVDEQGSFRYFIIDTGFWIFGKKVLLPVGYCQIDDRARRIYATNILNKKQVEDLPDYNDSTKVNRNYEARVRAVYTAPVAPVEVSAPLEASAPLDVAYSTHSANISAHNDTNNEHDTYNYHQDLSTYGLNVSDHKTFKLHEERLIASKKRRQTGEVVLGKHVETETARVSLPLETERVIIERSTPADDRTITSPGTVNFTAGEVARMKVYEETADIHKEAFVREEVRIRKEVERSTVEAEETLRREELDINSEDNQIIDKRSNKRQN